MLLRTVVLSIFLYGCVAAPLRGQTTSPSSANLSEIASVLTADTLADLPLGENVYSILETTQAEVIADRFNSAGLNVGESSRAGGFLGSWSQTLFRVGEIDVSDPAGSGASLLFPELQLWDRVTVANGLMSSDFNPPGLGVTLMPRLPTAAWKTIVRGTGSGGSLASSPADGSVPPIARLTRYGQASGLASGPLIADRLGIVAGGSWQGGSKFVREVAPAVGSDLESGFAHLVFTPSDGVESRTFGWIQRTRVPFAHWQLFTPDATTRDIAFHAQEMLNRTMAGGLRWQLNGAFTNRSRVNDTRDIPDIVADRLIDGPIPSIAAATGNQTAGRWTIDGRIQREHAGQRRHTVDAGATLDRTFTRWSDQFSGRIGEAIGGTQVRSWFYSHPPGQSQHHATSVAVFATDRIALSPALSLDTGVTFESIRGRAEGAASSVGWVSLLPRAVLKWEFGNKALVGGYRRAANRLNLDLLSFGDPNGETAIMTRYLGAPFLTAAIVDRVGPGTGGNAAFSRIDDHLKRPYTDEFVVGIESRRREWLRVGLTGIARREANVIGLVDIGVPISAYSTIGIPDPGHDFNSSTDDQTLTAYSRRPESYARNQYLLTNSDQQAATAFALKLWADGSTDKLTVLFGATASAANGSSGNRGYGPFENDQDAVGELLTNPNAAEFARGRLFSDRAFTVKWTMIYRFPKDIHVGAIARYQDGQPFARLVLAQDLNQGPELVRAYPNGGNRFTFTGTLDVRVQKGLTVGRQRVDGILDFYNLATRSNEVEEYTISGSSFRTPTAIEPPRAIHIGLRLTL